MAWSPQARAASAAARRTKRGFKGKTREQARVRAIWSVQTKGASSRVARNPLRRAGIFGNDIMGHSDLMRVGTQPQRARARTAGVRRGAKLQGNVIKKRLDQSKFGLGAGGMGPGTVSGPAHSRFVAKQFKKNQAADKSATVKGTVENMGDQARTFLRKGK